MTTIEFPPTTASSKPRAPSSGGPNIAGDHPQYETHPVAVAGDLTTPDAIILQNPTTQAGPGLDHQQANPLSIPRGQPPAGLSHPPISVVPMPKADASAGSHSTTDQAASNAQSVIVGCGQTSSGHRVSDTQSLLAAGGGAESMVIACSMALGPILADPILGLSADVLDDLENIRIANESRLRTLTATDEYGFGLTLQHPDMTRLAALVHSLKKAEHQAVLNLQRVMKQHPLRPWIDSRKGIGYKQAARLLAVIRDPYWNDLHDRPRTISELRSYCGVGDADRQVHRRGQKSNWNDKARKRLWLIADSCIKQKPEESKYRAIYGAARDKYADALHKDECLRCGPKGKPAQPRSPLSAGHQHARGMRLMMQEILKDLWVESKRLHEEGAAS